MEMSAKENIVFLSILEIENILFSYFEGEGLKNKCDEKFVYVELMSIQRILRFEVN